MIAAVFLLFACVVGPVSAFSGTGSGTAASPYIVTTVTQLNEVRDDLGAYYQLGADINLGSSGWTPIGSYTNASVNSPFTGVFDGNGHTISNLQINSPDSSYLGLFGYIADDAVIENLRLTNVEITGANYLGALAGYAQYSTITNCYSQGKVTGTDFVGGLIGYAYDYTIISDCHSSIEISGEKQVGGLIGKTSVSSITDSYASGSVLGKGNVGGLVGFIEFPTENLSNSYFNGEISCSNNNIGGLIGNLDTTNYATFLINNSSGLINISDTKSCSQVGGIVGNVVNVVHIEDCSIIGNITMDYREVWNIGGLVGHADSVYIQSSKYQGDILGYGGGQNMGGLVGHFNNHASISHSEFEGTLRQNFRVGGFIGYAEDSFSSGQGTAIIDNSSAIFSIIGHGYTGGLVGDSVAEIRDCQVSGIIESFEDGFGNWGSNFGGIAGYLSSGSSIISSSADVEIVGGEYVGGFIGSASSCDISDCYSTGDVVGTNNVGGFAGGMFANVADCYSLGNVSGSGGNVGGFVGSLYPKFVIGGNGSGSSINRCYAAGDVTGGAKSNVGGFVGRQEASQIQDCYALGDVSCSGENVGGFSGYSQYTRDKIINCYAAGDVISTHASAAVGGLLGSGSPTIENSVALNQMLTGKTGGTQERIAASHSEPEKYLTNNYGLSSMVIKIGREEKTPSVSVLNGENVNPETAQTQAFYTGLGWDFTKVWAMDKSISPYPIFRWQTDTPEIPVTPTVNTTETVSAAVPLGVGYELSPSKISEVTAPTVTRGKLSIVLDEKVVVTKSVGGTETAVAASVNADGSVKITGDISDAESLTVTFVGRKLGDISRDDRIGIVDMLSVGQHIVKINELDDKGQFYGDISGDGKIGIVDMLSIGQYIVGIADENYEKRK